MKKTIVFRGVLAALLIAGLMMPAVASAKAPLRAKGSFSFEDYDRSTYVYKWDVTGASDSKSAGGTFTFTQVGVESYTWEVTEVTQEAPGEIEFYAPGSWGIVDGGEPTVWGTGEWKVVDRGKGAGEVWAYCEWCEVYHSVGSQYWPDVKSKIH